MPPPPEPHRTERIGWLRAAVLGANDGIISTSSLMVGVAAASSSPRDIVVAGVAGLVAGALSMAAGEYVSVSSQADTERAELDRERIELATDPVFELQELTDIYIGRGLRPELARRRRPGADGKGCARRACARRTGVECDAQCPPSAGGLRIGRQFRRRRGVAAGHRRARAITRFNCDRRRSLVSLFALGALSAKIGGAPPV